MYEKSIGTTINDLDLCLEVVLRSCSHSITFAMSETVRGRSLVPKDHQ